MDLQGKVTVADGAPRRSPTTGPRRTVPGARLIVEESKLASAQDPLYVAFLGPLTDMASAILLDPEIVRRPIVVIWIGGVGYGGVETYPGIEFNLGNDITAANLVYDSGITDLAGAEQRLLAGLGQLCRAGREDRRHQRPRRLPDQPDGRVERHVPPGTDRVPLPRRLAGRLAAAVSPRRQFPHRARAPLRPRGPLPARLRPSRPGRRVRRRPLSDRRHVRQDPAIRPGPRASAVLHHPPPPRRSS